MSQLVSILTTLNLHAGDICRGDSLLRGGQRVSSAQKRVWRRSSRRGVTDRPKAPRGTRTADAGQKLARVAVVRSLAPPAHGGCCIRSRYGPGPPGGTWKPPVLRVQTCLDVACPLLEECRSRTVCNQSSILYTILHFKHVRSHRSPGSRNWAYRWLGIGCPIHGGHFIHRTAKLKTSSSPEAGPQSQAQRHRRRVCSQVR